ncbi:hypothetical protein Pmani_001309 [Petrolisthes manimaculis]|uniref:DUF7041 domain-containing protein n=1 Tax=Petrolisthes manimaculis TaxID=1843537 RepID=A0AAE1QJY9_9EUCA|nr:hypothetical protein Pmani_001309 [Petrolisthes manimaculis]
MSEPLDISDVTPTISIFRAPSFSSHGPTLWFTILEVNFRAHRITSSLKKFSVATTLLPPEVLSQLADSVTAAYTSDTPYEDLKTAITTRLEASLSTRLQVLLSKEELGNEKPTDLLRRMKKLIGTHQHSFDTTILTHLFYQRLPHTIQRNLFTVKGKLSLEDLAQLADEFMDTISNKTNICKITSSNEVSQLKGLISSLAVQVSELKLLVKQQSPAYSPSPRHHRSHSRDSRSTSNNSTNSNFNGMCYYYHRFGKNAHHCQQSCSFNSGNDTSSH